MIVDFRLPIVDWGKPNMSEMTPAELKQRTMDYALRCVKLAGALPKGSVGDPIARQLVRSATSVAANYRASCRARSRADFVSKMGLVEEEEADESLFWIEFGVEAGVIKTSRVDGLLREGNEIVAIVAASRKTARAGTKKPSP